MKKIKSVLLIFVLVSLGVFSNFFTVLGGEVDQANNPLNLIITTGIDNNKEKEITFDDSRLLVGSAKKNSKINIVVSYYDSSKNENVITNTYELTVKSMGIFEQEISLNLGENNISIVAINADVRSEMNYFITRKNKRIKEQLQGGVIIPSSISISQ